MRRSQPFANVDNVEPGPRRELERDSTGEAAIQIRSVV